VAVHSHVEGDLAISQRDVNQVTTVDRGSRVMPCGAADRVGCRARGGRGTCKKRRSRFNVGTLPSTDAVQTSLRVAHLAATLACCVVRDCTFFVRAGDRRGADGAVAVHPGGGGGRAHIGRSSAKACLGVEGRATVIAARINFFACSVIAGKPCGGSAVVCSALAISSVDCGGVRVEADGSSRAGCAEAVATCVCRARVSLASAPAVDGADG